MCTGGGEGGELKGKDAKLGVSPVGTGCQMSQPGPPALLLLRENTSKIDS